MILDYERALKITLPAARIAIAKRLKRDHHMNQMAIAGALGVAQAAVNKYLNGRYSAVVMATERRIVRLGLDRQAARKLLQDGDKRREIIDRLASDRKLVEPILRR